MKLKVIMFLAALVVASADIVGSAQAQIDSTEIAKVPFDFYAGGQKMPAGNYTIGIDVQGDKITLRDTSGAHEMFLMGISDGDGSDMSELVFEHSGDSYALKEVKSDVIDLSFRTRIPEQAMANSTTTEEVEVALNR